MCGCDLPQEKVPGDGLTEADCMREVRGGQGLKGRTHAVWVQWDTVEDPHSSPLAFQWGTNPVLGTLLSLPLPHPSTESLLSETATLQSYQEH